MLCSSVKMECVGNRKYREQIRGIVIQNSLKKENFKLMSAEPPKYVTDASSGIKKINPAWKTWKSGGVSTENEVGGPSGLATNNSSTYNGTVDGSVTYTPPPGFVVNTGGYSGATGGNTGGALAQPLLGGYPQTNQPPAQQPKQSQGGDDCCVVL